MATTRMTHPEHGYNIVYSSAEQKASEAQGWRVITEADFRKLLATKASAAQEESLEEVAEVEAPKKPGRPKKAG